MRRLNSFLSQVDLRGAHVDVTADFPRRKRRRQNECAMR